MNEADEREMELRWKRDRLSRELSGADADEESYGDTPAAPISKSDLKDMLLRDRSPKEKK